MTDAVKKFRGDILSGTLGTIAAYAIGILFVPLITRFYKPEHIGMWQVLLAFINLLIPLATLRFEDAIVLEESNKTVSRLLLIVVINTTIICTILLFGTFFIGNEKKIFFNLEVTPDITWMAIAGLILQVSLLILKALIIKQKKFKKQAITKVMGAIVRPVFAISILVFFDVSSDTYILSALLGILLESVLLYKWLNKQVYPRIFNWNKDKTLAGIIKYKVYPIYTVPYALSQGFIRQITLMSLAMLYSTSIVGAYTVARQLVSMPVSLLTAGLKQVIFSYASSAPKFDSTVNNRVSKLLINIVNLSIPFAVFGFFYLPDMINFALGKGWEHVGIFSRWMLIPSVALMLTSWLDRIFDVYGKQRLAVFLQISSDATLFLILLVCFRVKADALTTIISLSLFSAFYNLIWLFVVLNILKLRTSLWIGLISRIAIMAIIFSSMIMLLDIWLPMWVKIPVELLCLGGIVYFAYLKNRLKT